jgi:hypothetical protein
MQGVQVGLADLAGQHFDLVGYWEEVVGCDCF